MLKSRYMLFIDMIGGGELIKISSTLVFLIVTNFKLLLPIYNCVSETWMLRETPRTFFYYHNLEHLNNGEPLFRQIR